jgi:hypothetical protein
MKSVVMVTQAPARSSATRTAIIMDAGERERDVPTCFHCVLFIVYKLHSSILALACSDKHTIDQ